jgi:hypothetical protein
MGFHSDIRTRLLNELAKAGNNELIQLNRALRLLAKWRSVLILNTFFHHHGKEVLEGPFAGMTYHTETSEGCHVAKLLGSYEQPLHDAIEKAIHADYQSVINIGCAEGYYAVGLAARMHDAQIFAFDLDGKARESCASLAGKNHVTERVHVGAGFSLEDFSRFADQKVLVVCDIEGAENDLLNPLLAPALSAMDMIIESHDCLIPGTTSTLIDRFASTHSVRIIHDNGQRTLANSPDWFLSLPHLDQLLAVWEWRSGPTPWLLLRSRNIR